MDTKTELMKSYIEATFLFINDMTKQHWKEVIVMAQDYCSGGNKILYQPL